MKRLFIFFVLLSFGITAFCQEPTPNQTFRERYYKFSKYMAADSGIVLPVRGTDWTPFRPTLVFDGDSLKLYSGSSWRTVGGSGGDIATPSLQSVMSQGKTTNIPLYILGDFDGAGHPSGMKLSRESISFDGTWTAEIANKRDNEAKSRLVLGDSIRNTMLLHRQSDGVGEFGLQLSAAGGEDIATFGSTRVKAGLAQDDDDLVPFGQLMDTIAAIEATTLQSVTDLGNTTDNSIIITTGNPEGSRKLVLSSGTVDGEQVGNISNIATVGNVASSINLREGDIQLTGFGGVYAQLTISGDSAAAGSAGAYFNSRVSGLPAINGDEFVTLNQVSGAAGTRLLGSSYTAVPTSGTTETTLWNLIIPAGTMQNDGDVLKVTYSGIGSGDGDKAMALSIGGQVYYTHGQIVGSGTSVFEAEVTIIRTSATSCKTITKVFTAGVININDDEITGIDFGSNTSLSITGTAASATGELVLQIGSVVYYPN